jgi:hypothetical protein
MESLNNELMSGPDAASYVRYLQLPCRTILQNPWVHPPLTWRSGRAQREWLEPAGVG